MNKIKDPFSYGVGHGAIGLSCSHGCKYFEYNVTSKIRQCSLHNLMLNKAFLGEGGSVKGEWFCKNYEDFKDEINFGAHELGLLEFNKVKNLLEEGILYQACGQEYLVEINFRELREL
jgi:hypothetical protein